MAHHRAEREHQHAAVYRARGHTIFLFFMDTEAATRGDHHGDFRRLTSLIRIMVTLAAAVSRGERFVADVGADGQGDAL